VDVILII